MSAPAEVLAAALAELGVEHEERDPGQFLVTLPGTRRLRTHCWLVVREHALFVQAFVCRRPDENHDEVYRFLLQRNARLSGLTGADVWLKREDLQVGRSYKIRGAYNTISRLDGAARAAGVVCASAGNHGQGVAYACRALQVRGHVFVPGTTLPATTNGFGSGYCTSSSA